MNLLLFTPSVHDVTQNDFVEYWSKFYNYPQDHYYQNNIVLDQFKSEHIAQLYVWKNGMTLSDSKSALLQKIVSNLGLINELKSNWSDERFCASFGDVSAIWQIFLKHVIQPAKFPIFDQHVFRAYNYLKKGIISEISLYNPTKLKSYNQDYLPFYYEFEKMANKFPSKNIDNALWAFGRFLKEYPHLF